MNTASDIFRSAQQLITIHGDSASLHAAQRADELLAQGDMDGRRVWHQVQEAVKELQRIHLRNTESTQ